MKNILLSLELEGLPPTVNHVYRSTSGGLRYKTLECKEYQQYAVGVIRNAWSGKAAYKGRAELRITFETDSRRRWDIDNRIKALQDCLSMAGVIVDDTQIDELHVRRVYGRHKATIIELGGIEG